VLLGGQAVITCGLVVKRAQIVRDADGAEPRELYVPFVEAERRRGEAKPEERHHAE